MLFKEEQQGGSDKKNVRNCWSKGILSLLLLHAPLGQTQDLYLK
ncbi:unnamed protein product [Nezara viridula]|uniref:Uncharacterized protein n=1 Tax=Nezara viridula TaxID=85310 RepID=A0A9P0HMZ5_NEZVI|nr:unnamed protein product [Nezara viridula]